MLRKLHKLQSIQYLRAIAALGVVFYHASYTTPYFSFMSLGAAGVDLFFVISGFVIWSVTCAKPITPGEFTYQRIVRIVPIYWIFTLLLASAGILFPSAFSRLRVVLDDVVLSLLFIPHYSPSDGRILPILAPGWTLNYEMFFYALFALYLFLSPFLRLIALSSTIGILAFLGTLYSGSNPLILTYTNSLLLEFLGGIIIGRMWELDWLPGRKIGLVAALAGVIIFVGVSAWPLVEAYRVFMWGVPAFLIVLGLLSVEIHGGIFNSIVLGVLGDGSYSIYLIHGFVISALAKASSVLPKWGFEFVQIETISFVLISATLAATAGVVFHFLVERKLLSLLRRRRPVLVTNTSTG